MSHVIFFIIITLFLFVPLKESIHMFQQNRYQLERYRDWLKEEVHVKQQALLKLLGYMIILYALYLVPEKHQPLRLLMILLCIYAYVFYRSDVKKQYIQKLNVTHRAKRLFLVHVAVTCGSITCLQYWLSFRLLLACVPFLLFIPWLTLVVAAWICQPLENWIKESYVKDASDLLSKRDDLIRIGITGSYGKTSVKNILYALASEEYYAYMTPHSYNNLMGLTLSIRTQLQTLHQVFIAEMGADHVGEIERLSKFIHPSMAIITAVGPQHLSTFGTQENIVKEKMRLVENLPFHGIAILNYDNAWIRSYHVENPCQIITYGIHSTDVDVRAIDITYSEKGSQFTVITKDEQFVVNTILLGEHNVDNILAAICAARCLHIPTNEICSALGRLRYVEHRLEVRNMGTFTLLDDAYNSNPQGAGYALDVLAQMKGRRFLLTPGFLDLGEAKQEAHIAYAKKMKLCADEIFLIGPAQTKDIYETLKHEQFPQDDVHVCATTKEALKQLYTLVKKGDVALIENDLPDAFNH